MKKYKRIITLVLDSVGIGAMPDAEKYNDDQTVNTLGNLSEQYGLDLPNLQKLGLGNIEKIKTVTPNPKAQANFGKMAEKADGKDTLTGHWEMMGCTLEKGFKQFIDKGFPPKLIEEFEERTNRKILGNKEASGMKIIAEYYDEHIKTGKYILYTSVDSTFQIAAHEDIVPLEELYQACEIARELTKTPEYSVARVIARPFLGDKDNFYRTSNRHDYALNPTNKTIMEELVENNIQSVAIGKINDIFNGHGITKVKKNKNNMHGVDNLLEELQEDYEGHIFVNLVDFDSIYGHPRDPEGYKKSLEEFDQRIPEILQNLQEDDLLIITADHGNDPTYKGNDHTREYVPLLVYNQNLEGNNNLGIRQTFADIGATISDNFNINMPNSGKSFLDELK